MTDFSKPPSFHSPSPAIVQGVISTLYAVSDGLTGRSDGKVYHRYEPGGMEERDFSEGCAFAVQRLMDQEIWAQELESEGVVGSRMAVRQLMGELRRKSFAPRRKL